MYKAERLQRIEEILTEQKRVDVSTLSLMLNVTETTIRTDLEQLEKSGFVTRYHGGATLKTAGETRNQLHNVSAEVNIPYDKEKEELAKVAAQMVGEREWIFLGPGTTCYYIAKALSGRDNLNIMTNNFFVTNILSSNPSIRLLFLGGRVQNEGMYTVPDDIKQDLEKIYLNKAFFSVDAASLDGGYTLTDIYILDIIRTVCGCCNESVICVDSKKFNRRSFMRLDDLSFAAAVVSDQKLLPEYQQYYIEHGVKVCTP